MSVIMIRSRLRIRLSPSRKRNNIDYRLGYLQGMLETSNRFLMRRKVRK